MIARSSPYDAYRSVEYDARAASAAPGELAAMCYEAVISALGRALIADARADNRMKSEALTRAVAALTALQLGVSDSAGARASANGGVVDALRQMYASAKRAALDSVLAFDAATIGRLRADFVEIAQALAPAKTGP